MTLRKCPGCKNTIAAETETCPICGCNPRTRRVRNFLLFGAASAVIIALLGGQFRQHLGGFSAPSPAQAVPAGR